MSSRIDIVPNPVVTEFIDPFGKRIPRKEVMDINPDDMYNLQVSSGSLPPAYLPSNEDRGFLMSYIKADSDCIPNDSAKKMYYNSINDGETHWMPLDYILFTRSDGTNFLLAENISDKEVIEGVKSYSLLRYSNYSGKFNESTIFSDGIDVARIRNGDKEYIDAIADRLLSEKRINEALLSVDRASRYKGTDEITHASGYVGYVNSNTLDIESTLDGNKPRILEKNIKDNQLMIVDETPLDTIVYSLKSLIYRFKQLFVSKDASWGGVVETGTIIPDDVLKRLLRETPIEEIIQLDKEEGKETISLDNEREVDSEVANQSKELDDDSRADEEKMPNTRKAKETIASLRTIARVSRNKPHEMFNGPRVPNERDSNDEIGNN